ncbi:tyrosine-type recombinase/integrase [Heyndrickxia sporothermodurans]|uniref:Tyrosine-type recombinase/integrase n=4 Tax=Bacillaceae TaxID=186817 RepID=A0A6B3VY85_9BACI|nr:MULTISPECIES: site-specific integrase [Bacillaceae]MBA4537645.1 tyrosine-type recombinase/integrase [Bacillus aquiflavi]MBL5766603.1 tyrosine-type recombinase/integrase [Heyndrickxia sporothermodurans]MBL5770042.1 tyrosine-type recombinase/integrase [Heyndrickxia sporothermodurans]MBL5773719.1 tyrosine-type recombinase/integrase [Heyndrickxia sporothermodurans]MBL5777295.1 tyrosine-type recombinase/integrase [Heyndrickxia sporothermodurans]
MTINNNLPLVDYTPSKSVKEARCGNNKFSDDIWDFKGFVEAPHWNDAKFRIDFTSFSQWESIKITIKKYIHSELLMNGFNSVKRKHSAFKQLIDFLNENHSIESFQDFTDNTIREYFQYLLKAISERGTPLSPMSIKKSAQVVKELLIRGGQRDWEVPTNTTKINSIYNELIINNKTLKEGTKFGVTNKVLPEEEVINSLIKTAREQLEKGEDVLTSASILLSTQLGLRISEVVLIQEGCLSVINGEYQITYLTSKTQKTPERVTRPANEIVVEAIRALEKHSKPLIRQFGEPYLFLTYTNRRKDPITIASHSNWTAKRLNPFIKKHDLRDEKGNLLKLTQHYFRHIFATYALKGGMKLHDVAEMMNHKSIMMTETYDHTKGQKQEVIKDILSGEIPVTTTNKIVLESLEGEENPFKGLTTDQVDKMRRALKIELLPHGMCLHHPMRGEPCEQDGVCLGCHEFIASARHLPVYEARLERVEQELNTLDNDKSIYTTKLRFQQGMLEKYVSDLQKKLAEKEFQEALLEVAGAKHDE